MCRLGFIGIIVRVITRFLTNLKRREAEWFATFGPSFGKRKTFLYHRLLKEGSAVYSLPSAFCRSFIEGDTTSRHYSKMHQAASVASFDVSMR